MFPGPWFTLVAPLLVFGAGHAVVRRVAGLRLNRVEAVAVRMGVGLLVVWLAGFLGFVLLRENVVFAYWGVSAGAGILTLVHWREIASLVSLPTTRRVVAAWAVVFLGWSLYILSQHNLTGAAWSGDSVEHFQRAQYFLGRFADDFRFIDRGTLPGRPPMQNELAAWVMAHQAEGAGFAGYQWAMVMLASLVVFPCAVLVRRFGGRASSVWALVGMLLLSVGVVAHVVTPWTKLLSAGFVVLGVALYWRARSDRRVALAAAMMGAGCLVHYSACVPTILVGGHFLVSVLRRGEIKRAWPLVVGVVVFLPWIGFSFARFGVKGTFASNTVVADEGKAVGGNAMERRVFNLVHTALPHPVLMSRREFEFGHKYDRIGFQQESRLGLWRDYFFTSTVTNFPLAIGVVGAGVCLVVIVRRRQWGWAGIVVGSCVLGVVTHATIESWGVAHVVLVAKVLWGVSFAAAWWPRFNLRARQMVAVGILVESLLLLGPHLVVQGFEWEQGERSPLLNQYAMSGELYGRGQGLFPAGNRLEVSPEAGMVIFGLGMGMGWVALWKATHPKKYSRTKSPD